MPKPLHSYRAHLIKHRDRSIAYDSHDRTLVKAPCGWVIKPNPYVPGFGLTKAKRAKYVLPTIRGAHLRMTPEQRKAHRKDNRAHRKLMLTPEKKHIMAMRRRIKHANRTPAQKEAARQRRKAKHAAMTPAQKEASRARRKAKHAAMTPAQKAAHRARRALKHPRLSADEKAARKQARRDAKDVARNLRHTQRYANRKKKLASGEVHHSATVAKVVKHVEVLANKAKKAAASGLKKVAHMHAPAPIVSALKKHKKDATKAAHDAHKAVKHAKADKMKKVIKANAVTRSASKAVKAVKSKGPRRSSRLAHK